MFLEKKHEDHGSCINVSMFWSRQGRPLYVVYLSLFIIKISAAPSPLILFNQDPIQSLQLHFWCRDSHYNFPPLLCFLFRVFTWQVRRP